MKIVVAPEDIICLPTEIKCFLGGGITNCPEWQQEVIAKLEKYDAIHPEDLNRLVIFNPRRENFPIDDPNAARQQISWEFKWLQKMDIFSMFFTAGESDQPICMYELGRNVSSMEWTYGCDEMADRLVLTSEEGYKRLIDVVTQMNLACCRDDIVYVYDDSKEAVKNHARRIVEAYRKL